MEDFQKLEQEFGDWINFTPSKPNHDKMVACASGTAALQLAIESMHLPRGSEVIVPQFTMIACARAVTMAGLVPKFVDCGDDLLINPALLQEKLTEKTRVIMPVHIYGRMCDMDRISGFAKANNLKVIEDLAEAHGMAPHEDTDAACWSFYRNKIVAGEEGGIIAFKDARDAKTARALRSMGFTDNHDFMHMPGGFNGRMSNAHARPILESLRNVNINIQKREQVERWYDARIPAAWKMPDRAVCWVYDIRIPGMVGRDQDAIIKAMKDRGIAARHGFKPMSMQPEYSNAGETRDLAPIATAFGAFANYKHLNAYRLCQEVIYLPVFPDMAESDVERIVTELCHYQDIVTAK